MKRGWLSCGRSQGAPTRCPARAKGVRPLCALLLMLVSLSGCAPVPPGTPASSAEPEPSSQPQASSLQSVPEQESLSREMAEPSEQETPADMAGEPENISEWGTVRVLTPSAPGNKTFTGPGVTIDYSNAEQGYVMVQYSGRNPKVKLQMNGSDQILYTYTLRQGQFDAFPLTSGNGTYTLKVYENVAGSQYALLASHSFEVQLRSALLPYLYPNQYVSFTSSSAAVAKGAELAEGAKDDLEVVQRVYGFVTENVVYDDGKAQSATDGSLTGYLPDVDETLSSCRGICFDYAALMTAMLRSQGIPTRLEVGYVTGGIYHAWISVYLQNEGWVNGIIHFDGKKWTLMDPTFEANGGGSEEIRQFIGNGSNYSTKFVY